MELRLKIGSSQDNVGSFISEMSSLLESHDLKHLFEDMSFPLEAFGGEEQDDHQQHAGTGSGSRIKSRPARRRVNPAYQNR